MRTYPLIIIIIVSLVGLYYYNYGRLYEDAEEAEGYATAKPFPEGYETLRVKVDDRTNPLANLQNPLTNPAVPIGIPEADAAQLMNMNKMALNVSQSTKNYDTIYPRVDNENSYLGMVKMCKEKGVGDQPFNDPAFAENCGMCLSSGTLRTGETFTKPTGVLVYAADKADFIKEKEKNGYNFPLAIPSLQGATCDGATRSENSDPVLPITKDDYELFKRRIACQASHSFENGCAQCVSNKVFSWLDPNGGIRSITLWLWGSGTAVVTVGGKATPLTLSMDKGNSISLGKVAEGTTMSIAVKQDVDPDGPYLYGIITSITPNNKRYKLPIEKFLDVDSVSGTFIKKGTAKYFSEVNAYPVKIIPQANARSFTPTGFIPLTFVAEQLAAYDCPTSPYVSSQASAELLMNDPCLNPKGQGPGTYTMECLKKSVLSAGCSTNGTWYNNPVIPSGVDINSWIATMKSQNETLGKTDNTVSMGCSGIDIKTPCDPYINGGTPSQECLVYLYSNTSERGKLGRSYASSTSYTSKQGKTYQFCQPAGTLNPTTPNGAAELRTAWAGYSGLTGIEAVRRFLSDVFTKATGDLNINLADSYGGRKDSWTKCINMPIENVPEGSISINSRGSVINNALPPTPTAPSMPTVSMSNNSSSYTNSYILNVNWSASDNGSPITAYIVTLSGGGSSLGPWTVTFTAASYGPTQGINVNANTQYTVRVVARNAIGDSPAGTATIQTPGLPLPPTPPATHPSAPTNFTSSATANSITVNWNPPQYDGGAPIDYYQLEAGFRSLITGGLSFTFTNVSPGTSYFIKVFAHNSAGFFSAYASVSGSTSSPQVFPPAGILIRRLCSWGDIYERKTNGYGGVEDILLRKGGCLGMANGYM